jgi:excinuclease UvrABC nuclease subunit
VHISEPIRLNPTSESFERELSDLRRKSGVYLLHDSGAAVHLSWSRDLERRLRRLLLTSHRGALLAEKLETVECWPAGSKLEQQLLLYSIARRYYPESYNKILKLRAPWFVALTNEPYARLETANKVRDRHEALWGPFRSRAAAEQYEQEVLGLFQMRRCSEPLAPASDHPGCIYGEMNQCLRPCQLAVSAAEYAEETARTRDFLRTNGRTRMAALISARDRASQEFDFEQASQIHKRIERLKNAASWREPVIEEISQFNGIALTTSSAPGEVVFWPMLSGLWQEPLRWQLPEESAEAKSLDTEIRELLSLQLAHPRAEGDCVEELAVFARWFYSSWRDGEWFPFGELSNLNYRKLIREVSKLRQSACPSTKK